MSLFERWQGLIAEPLQFIRGPSLGACFADELPDAVLRAMHGQPRFRQRLEQLLVQVMASKLEVFDPHCLRQQLEARKIRFMPHQSPYCWAYQLIARGARVISKLDAYGLALLPEFRERSLADLRDAIDREFFLLSEAHYERYIAPGFIREAFGPPLIASF